MACYKLVVILILALQWSHMHCAQGDAATVIKPFLQSFFDLFSFWATNDFETEEPEVFINTTGAGIVYNAENQEEHEDEDSPHLLQKPSDPTTTYCRTGNYIDDCWRCDPTWSSHRQQLASCAIGFGSNAVGGKYGMQYIVTSSDDDRKNPAPGTLRYGVTRTEPLWITFLSSMTIQLQGELEVTSFKTIDGRGAQVHLVGTSQITIEK